VSISSECYDCKPSIIRSMLNRKYIRFNVVAAVTTFNERQNADIVFEILIRFTTVFTEGRMPQQTNSIVEFAWKAEAPFRGRHGTTHKSSHRRREPQIFAFDTMDHLGDLLSLLTPLNAVTLRFWYICSWPLFCGA
jgi:hypothetical protein